MIYMLLNDVGANWYAPVQVTKFPAGEINVRVGNYTAISNGTPQYLQAIIKNSDDVMGLLLTVDAIRQISPDIKIHLEMPYVPYARQDRVCNGGEALSIKVFANLINNLNLNSVTIHDPHSDVTPALLNNCRIVEQSAILGSLLAGYSHRPFDALVAPDVGASKKVDKLAKAFNYPMLQATKSRDVKNGALSNPKIEDIPEEMNKLLVVDDIIEGGYTFVQLGELIKERYPDKKLYLYATHGLFSRGINGLDKYYECVYTHNLLNDDLENNEFIKVI